MKQINYGQGGTESSGEGGGGGARNTAFYSFRIDIGCTTEIKTRWNYLSQFFFQSVQLERTSIHVCTYGPEIQNRLTLALG